MQITRVTCSVKVPWITREGKRYGFIDYMKTACYFEKKQRQMIPKRLVNVTDAYVQINYLKTNYMQMKVLESRIPVILIALFTLFVIVGQVFHIANVYYGILTMAVPIGTVFTLDRIIEWRTNKCDKLLTELNETLNN